MKSRLLSSTFIPVLVGAGVVVGGAVAPSAPGYAAGPSVERLNPLPVARPKPATIQLAQCKPCNPCNPCAAKKGCNPCNPCAPKRACNPCSPCAAKGACGPCGPCGAGAAASSKCFVPRLRSAAACNPCAAKKRGCNPCNPCAAKKACAPCSPCAAKKACAPCAPCGPCGPCGPAAAAEITPAEARAAYKCLIGEMTASYAKAGLKTVSGYTGWTRVNTSPYQSATHGNRYVNNYADKHAAQRYTKFEKAGLMPAGSVIAKDSFAVRPDGSTAVGPLFVMEKMTAGFSPKTGNWRYTLIMPNGAVIGTTKGKGAASVKFCAECHMSMGEGQDSMTFLPEEFRKKF
ncbi:MAG: cytochrome P460 family protein [Proteobacteria bacterium]|nr:cytochrome P460 family protein [Pseudomonadota bacterium]